MNDNELRRRLKGQFSIPVCILLVILTGIVGTCVFAGFELIAGYLKPEVKWWAGIAGLAIFAIFAFKAGRKINKGE